MKVSEGVNVIDGVSVIVVVAVLDGVLLGGTKMVNVMVGVKVNVEVGVNVSVGEGVTVGVSEGVAEIMAGPGLEVGI